MYPVEPLKPNERPKIRRYPYVIVPVDPPKCEIPEGHLYMESLVFSLIQHPAEKVLADYCKFKKLDSSKFVCRPITFAKDLRKGKGALCIQQDGDRFRGRIDWR
jgi:hypothetical protein